MKAFNLEEYLKDPNRKVVTREGIPVKIHCTNYGGPQPIIAEIEGIGFSEPFSKYGVYYNPRESRNDLFFAPERKEGWVNVYQEDNQLRCGNVYDTKSEAEQHGSYVKRLATAKIEWEE